MTNTNTPGDIIERKDKRVWSKYNPSLVNRIDILLDTSFLESWNGDLEKENDGKVGHPYEYPQEFFIFLSRMRSLWNVRFRELEGFVRKLNPESSLLYDMTSIPSYSVAPVFEYGHAKDHDELEQVNFPMLMEKSRGIPLYYELYPGSIPDIVTLKRTIEYLSPRIKEMKIVLDRGFFSVDNLRLISRM